MSDLPPKPPKEALGAQRAKRGTRPNIPPPAGQRTGGSRRSRGRKEDKPALPPKPLEPTVQLKIGNKAILPRCQYWDMRPEDPYIDGSPLRFFQCGQPARPGYSVCGFHGVGWKKREKAGHRQPQRSIVAEMFKGNGLDERVQGEFLDNNPIAKSRYEFHLQNPQLLDFWPVIAMARTCLEHFMDLANLDKTETMDGSDPPIVRAVEMARKLVGICKDASEYERRLGQVTNAEVERHVNATAIVLARFLEPKQLEAARQCYIELVTRTDSFPMGRLRLQDGRRDPGEPGPGTNGDDPGDG